MARPDPRLVRLQAVTTLGWEVARRRLAEKLAEERAVEAQLAELDAARAAALHRLGAGADDLPRSVQVATTGRWLRWAEA